MTEASESRAESVDYPVEVRVRPQLEARDRLTTFFRFFLALPHMILVGAPVASVATWSYTSDGGGWEVGSSGGVVSAVIAFVVLFAWVYTVVTARTPDRLWKASAWYLRWRVKAIAYMTLLRDEYPPFGEGEYPVDLVVSKPTGSRSRLTVFFRLLLAVPHYFVLAFLGVAWSFVTAVAWAVILFTGRYPKQLYGFALGVLAWTTRVEAYCLLLRDAYPPFTLRA
jgi:hypothetical protein